MKPPPFAYVAPSSLDETIQAVASDPDAKILAGGQSLIPLLALRLANPTTLVDIGRIPGLDSIEDGGSSIRIGAMTTQWEAEKSEAVARRVPMVASALKHVAHPAIRSRGTVGGSIAHADPAAELPAIAVALDGNMEVRGPAGTRSIAAEEYFKWPFTTSMRPDEILVAISLPTTPTGWAFLEVARRPGDFATALVAVVLRMDGNYCSRARVVIGGATTTTTRASGAETLLTDTQLDDRTIEEAAIQAASEVELVSDLHGSASYRKGLVHRLVRRGVTDAARSAP